MMRILLVFVTRLLLESNSLDVLIYALSRNYAKKALDEGSRIENKSDSWKVNSAVMNRFKVCASVWWPFC